MKIYTLFLRLILLIPIVFNISVLGTTYISLASLACNAADLAITNSDSPDPVYVDDNLTYLVTVTNRGPLNATGVNVTDTLPPGVTFQSATPSAGAASNTTNTVTWNIGNLAKCASATLTILVTAPSSPGNITNSATISGSEPDPNPANNTASEDTTVTTVPPAPEADLQISKSDSPDPVYIGDNLTYLVSVTNSGPDNATGVNVTDTLPPGVTFQSATPSTGTASNTTNTVTWNIGNLAKNASANLTILVTAPSSSGNITNSATISGSEPDPDTNNNSASEDTTVTTVPPAPEADLQISKSDSPDPVYIGDNLTYLVSVTNNGPDNASSVNVTDTLPPGVTFQSATPSTGTASNTTNTVTWNIGTLINGASANLTILVTAPSSSGNITNSATISGSEPDPDTNNNSASEDTTVTTVPPAPEADLQISKSDSPDPVYIGDNLTYLVSVTNNGPDNASSVNVTDTLPPGVTFQSATPSAGTASNTTNTVTWNIGNLAKNASANLTILVTAPSSSGNITNSATISGSEPDPDTNNNTASEDTTVDFATIYGTVFEDVDGDGLWDVGEQGIANVTVTLDGTDNTTTDISGGYTFSVNTTGHHSVHETDPAGYFSTSPNVVFLDDLEPGKSYQVDFGDAPIPPAFTYIIGTVFEDLNGNGTRDIGELGIPNVAITLDNTIANTTNIFGYYAFAVNTTGVHFVNETDLAGYFSTTPNEVHVDIELLGTMYQIDFGDAPIPIVEFASIYGTVFEDLNGNGTQDSSELGIPNVTITLDSTSSNTTDGYGRYTCKVLTTDNYTLEETDPAGYFSTTANEVHVNVNTLDEDYEVNFGDAPENSNFASFFGTVFEDNNVNGMWDDDEPGIPDVTVSMNGTDNMTDAYGRYTFKIITTDNYTATEEDPVGYVSTNAIPGEPAVKKQDANTLQVEVSSLGMDFGNNLFGDVMASDVVTISGQVWEDNGPGDEYANGQFDSGEPGLAGAIAYLSTGLCQTTDSTGFFLLYGPSDQEITITEINPSSYNVTAEIPAGYAFDYWEIDGNLTIGIDPGWAPQYSGSKWGEWYCAVSGNGTLRMVLRTQNTPGSDWLPAYTGNITTVEPYILSPYTITFETVPANTGNITFDGDILHDGDTVERYPAYVSTNAIPGDNVTYFNHDTLIVAPLAASANSTGNLFGDVQIGQLATIEGTVFDDANENGVFDGSESGLPDVTVTMEISGGNTTSVNTTLDGEYWFVVAPGTDLRITSAEPGGDYYPTTLESVIIRPPSGGLYPDNNFGYSDDPDSASIYGAVFEDVDGDGKWDAGELGIPGVNVTLEGIGSNTTDTLGGYTFSVNTTGYYTVNETDPVGYYSTTPNKVTRYVELGNSYQVDFGDSDDPDSASIYGTVFEDVDGDGKWDAGELGIPGVNVTLEGIGSNTTDTLGGYTFSVNTTGYYTVNETDPAGYFSTTPNTRTVNVTTLSTDYVVNFGDAPEVPDIDVDPTYIDFGSVALNLASANETVTITNVGTANLTIGTIYISGSDANQFDISSDNASSQTLVPGASANVSVQFMPTSTGSKSAYLGIPSNDPYQTTATVTLDGKGTIFQADLDISKSDNPDPVYIGDNLTYTLTVTNSGPDNATGVNVTDNLPSSVTYLNHATDNGTASHSAGTVTWNIGTLVNGASANLTILVTAPSSSGYIDNYASVSSNEYDPGINHTWEDTYVNPGPLDHIIISPDSASITAGDNITYTAEAFDQSNNSLGDVTVNTTFTIDPVASGIWTQNVYTSEKAGTWTVTGNYTGKSDNATLTINLGPLEHIIILPDSASITAGDNITYTAEAFDQSNNSLGNVTANTTFTIDPAATGNWTQNVYASEKAGTWTVTGNYTGKSDNATLTVNPGPPVSLDLTPDGGITIISLSNSVMVTAYDIYGNVATGYNGTVNFTSTDPFATLPADYPFTPSDAGTHTFIDGVTFLTTGNQTVTVTDTIDSSLTDAEISAVTNPISMEILPATATIFAGNYQTYQAIGYLDLMGIKFFADVSPFTTFSVDPGAGGNWTLNTYTSQNTGNWTVTGNLTAANITLLDTAKLTVLSPPHQTDHIVISPPTATIISGATQTYTADLFDQSNNWLADVTPLTAFSIDAGAGGNWTLNTYTSQNTGNWTITGNLTVANLTLLDTANLTVFGPPLLDHIVISPPTANITAGDNQTYTADAYDQSNNWLLDVTPWTTFSINPGAGGSWTLNTYTSQNAGNWTVTGNLTLLGMSDTANLTVNPGPPVSLDLTPDNGLAISGLPFNVTVTAYDNYSNIATSYNGTANFTSSDPSATLPTDYAFTPADAGTHTFIDGVTFLTTGNQTVSVTDTIDSLLTDTSTFTVIPPPDHIEISPPAATIISGATQTYTADAYDQSNNWLADVTPLTAFSIDTGAGGNWMDNIYTSQNTGNWTVTGNLTLLGMSDTANLTVFGPPLLDHIVISPSTATINRGATQTYTADAYDQSNNWLLDVTPWTTFSINPGAGGSWTLNTYKSQNAGTWTVTGNLTLFGMSDTAQLTVKSPPIPPNGPDDEEEEKEPDEEEKFEEPEPEPEEEEKYFVVDFLGKITTAPIKPDGSLLKPLRAESADGKHILEIEKGTKALDAEGEIVLLTTITALKIGDPELPDLPRNTKIVGNAYDFQPSGIIFSEEVRLTMSYNINDLPENVESVTLSYYNPESGWTDLQRETIALAEVGKITSSIKHFTIFAVLAKVTPPPAPTVLPPAPPANFILSNLSITPSLSKAWEHLTFIVRTGKECTISVEITNIGGQHGSYTANLIVNGVLQETKEISLDPGQTQKIIFLLSDNERGNYVIQIDDSGGEFESLIWINWWLFAGFAVIIILLCWLAWRFLLKGKGEENQGSSVPQ